LFILLFILVYQERNEDFLREIQLKFGGKIVEQTDAITAESLLVSQVQGYIEENKLDDALEVLVDEKKVKIIMEQPVLFDTGSAYLKTNGKSILKDVGAIIGQTTNPILIEGHTDNRYIHNKQYDSNWDLSFHRAYSVLMFYIYKMKFLPTQLSGIWYGEHRPIASNSTKEGQAKNRRVELSIVRVNLANSE